MSDSTDGLMTVQAELRAPLVTLQVVRFVLPHPTDRVLRASDGYRLDLCLTPRPRNARACFSGAWGPHRFEPIGDLFLVPPGTDMHVRGDSGRQVSIICRLARHGVEHWLDRDVAWTDRRLEASLDLASRHIRSLLIRLADEAHRPGIASAELAELIARQLAIELGRFCAAVRDGPVAGGLATWRLRVIDDRLSRGKPPTLAELARNCNISVRHLTRGFRASRGCSVNDYVLHSRIERAKRLLIGDESVKAVAFETGFASASSFACAFLRATGATPSHFRQRLRSANLCLPAETPANFGPPAETPAKLRLPAETPRDGPPAMLRPAADDQSGCQGMEIYPGRQAPPNGRRAPSWAAAGPGIGTGPGAGTQ